jgi:Flp pilus assembly protein TadD
MKLILKILLVVAVVVALTACGAETPPAEVSQAEATSAPVEYPTDFDTYSLQQKVEFYIENDLYTEAFDALRGQDESDAAIRELKIAAHMTYGLYLTYGSLTDMRTRMPEALRHYRKVVELDPENAQAKAEIEQIEGIYRSLNREIPQGVAE